jgi:hypothetical protein
VAGHGVRLTEVLQSRKLGLHTKPPFEVVEQNFSVLDAVLVVAVFQEGKT